MKNLYVFDFDGTITHSDSLPLFIEFAVGRLKFRLGLILFLPLIIIAKLRLYHNGRAKEKLFSYFFKGMPAEQFDNICVAFATTRRKLLRKKAMCYIRDKVEKGYEVVVLTASIDKWVAPFFADMPEIKIIGTQIEEKKGYITGNFASPNCYAAEKVVRLKQAYPHTENYNIIAFGDSQGDKDLLNYASEAHYKPFR